MNFVLLSFLIFFVGCATGPLKKEQALAVNDVSAVALFPNTLPVKYLGTTIFNNDHNYPNVVSWDLNQHLVQTLESGLKTIDKNYKKVTFDRSKVNQLLAKGDTVGNRFAGEEDQLMNEYLFETATKAGAKFLFVFKPIAHDNYRGYSPGIALYCHSAFGIEGEWQGYVLAHVSLWDLQTKEAIYRGAITPHDVNFMTKQDCNVLKKTTPEKFANSHKNQIIELAKSAASFALKESGLTSSN